MRAIGSLIWLPQHGQQSADLHGRSRFVSPCTANHGLHAAPERSAALVSVCTDYPDCSGLIRMTPHRSAPPIGSQSSP